MLTATNVTGTLWRVEGDGVSAMVSCDSNNSNEAAAIAAYQESTTASVAPDASLGMRAEVQRTIFAIADQNTQMSLAGAAAAQALSAADFQTFQAAQAWVEAVKAEGRLAVLENRQPVWPEVPAGVQELADRF